MKIKILIALLIVILAIGAVSASDENISSDNLTADEDLQVESSIEQTEVLSDNNDGTFSELSALIKNTPESGVLTLDKNYKSTSKDTITISKAMTIDGNNHTLDADKSSRIFNIVSAGVVLKNIVFENGYSQYTGGAISYQTEGMDDDCYCTISKCSFINCQAQDSGAIGFVRGYAFSDGGHGYSSGCNGCSVEDCTFINCSAKNNGGAFCFYDEYFNGAIRNCNFINCSANNKGGAIHFYDFETDYSLGYHYYYYPSNGFVDNCSFLNCHANYGGAIHAGCDSFDDPLYLERSYNSTISNCNFVDCSAIHGGSIYWNSTYGLITNSNFTKSHSKNGGAVYAYKDINLAIINSDFKNNTAEESGSAVYGGCISNCSFSQNTNPEIYALFDNIKIGKIYADINYCPIRINLPKNTTGNCSLYVSFNDENYTFIGSANITDKDVEINYEPAKLGNYKFRTILNTNYGVFESFEETTISNIYFIYDRIGDIQYLDAPQRVTLNLPKNREGNFSLYVKYENSNYTLYDCVNITNGNAEILFKAENEGKCQLMAICESNYGFASEIENVTFEDGSYIWAPNANIFYNDAGKYTIEVYDRDTNPVAKNTLITLKIGSKTLNSRANEDGEVTFNIPKLKPGTYTITANYFKAKITKKLTVKHIVSLKTVKVKKSAKKLTLQATLKNKKAIKGKTVTFKFNGKTYKAKTDKKGIAKVTIKSSVLKKLKVGKKITYQATYLKDTVKKIAKVQK